MEISGETELTERFSVARGLTWRYITALALVASFATAAWVSLELVISKQKNTAAVVNISGRQRMLSQRTALFANMLVNAPNEERPIVRSKLKEAILLMERSHHGLTHGDKEMGLPREMSETVHALYFEGDNPLDQQVETYIKIVNQLLELDDAALQSSNSLLIYITQNAPNILVRSLDQMVHQYQLEGEQAINRLEKAETIFWVVTLLLLLLEALLIFNPFVRHLNIAMGKLQSVTNELRLHHLQLEETIQNRTAELELRSKALVESEEKFRLISTAANDAIIIVREQEEIIYWNPAAEKLFGYQAIEVIGEHVHTLLVPQRYREVAQKGFERFRCFGDGKYIGKTFEILALHKNSTEFPIELSISAFNFQNQWHALGIIRDITERRRLEDQIRRLAFYDALTELPNRRLIEDRLNHAMMSSKRTGHYIALIVLDLDNFKPLNDAHGHAVGDLLLMEAAKRLKGCVREIDTVGRYGGDEFIVLLNELDEDRSVAIIQARNVAAKILTSMASPYQLILQNDDIVKRIVQHSCSASLGIHVFINHDATQDNIFKQADRAMYKAKEAGRNQICFSNIA